MRIKRVYLLAVLACRGPDRQPLHDSVHVSSADTLSTEAYEGSVLWHATADPSILPNGDTIANLGEWPLDKQRVQNYVVVLYRRNSAQTLSIWEMVGRTPNGEPLFTTRARMRLPPVDSTEEVITQGFCDVDGTHDSFVFGVIRPIGDSAQWQASHAWRFDLPSHQIREIPASGVKCGHIVGED